MSPKPFIPGAVPPPGGATRVFGIKPGAREETQCHGASEGASERGLGRRRWVGGGQRRILERHAASTAAAALTSMAIDYGDAMDRWQVDEAGDEEGNPSAISRARARRGSERKAAN